MTMFLRYNHARINNLVYTFHNPFGKYYLSLDRKILGFMDITTFMCIIFPRFNIATTMLVSTDTLIAFYSYSTNNKNLTMPPREMG